MDNQQGPIVLHRELYSMLCGSLDGRRVWGRVDTCRYTAESLCCPLETITVLLISYTPIKKLKSLILKRKHYYLNQEITCDNEDMDKCAPLCYVGGIVNWCSYLENSMMKFPQKN